MFHFDAIVDQVPCVQHSQNRYAENNQTCIQCIENTAGNVTPIVVAEIVTIVGFQYAKIWLQIPEDVDFVHFLHGEKKRVLFRNCKAKFVIFLNLLISSLAIFN